MNWNIAGIIIQGVATFVALGAAIFSFKAAQSSEIVAKASHDPIIRPELDPNGIGPGRFSISLKNTGKGLAKNLLFVSFFQKDKSWSIIEPDKAERINYDFNSKDSKEFTLKQGKVTYENVFGDKFITEIEFNFYKNQVQGISWSYSRKAI